VTFRGTITAVLLGFVFAYAMFYSRILWKPFSGSSRSADAVAALRGGGQLRSAVRSTVYLWP